MTPGDIDRFFEDLSRRVDRPVRILLTGGAAAILQGVERATFDIDFQLDLDIAGSTGPEGVQRAIDQTAQATGITPQYSEDIDLWSAIALPSKRSRRYRRFGKIDVRVLAPGLWAIGKLTRYLSTDIQDLRAVLQGAKERPAALVKLWGTALGISPASNSQALFRRQVEDFLDRYGREIWGPATDIARLRTSFVKTALKTRAEKERGRRPPQTPSRSRVRRSG